MKKVQFTIEISASKERVWHVLWDDANYRAWTSVFTQGSHAVSDWKEGSKIQFLDAKGAGMYGIIAKNIPLTHMSFQHMGEIKNGEEVPMPWAGATENYTLTDNGNGTTLLAEMDATPEFEAFFNQTFPKAMAKIKEISEE